MSGSASNSSSIDSSSVRLKASGIFVIAHTALIVDKWLGEQQ